MNKAQLRVVIMENAGISFKEAARALDSFDVVLRANSVCIDDEYKLTPMEKSIALNNYRSGNKSDRKRNRANRWR